MTEGKNHGTAKWLRIALLVGLAVLCFYVIRPFGSAVIWAIIISFSLYPLQMRFARWMGGRESLAAATLTVLMILVLILPLGLLGISMIDGGKNLVREGKQQIVNAPDEPPSWLTGIPIIGGDLGGYWDDFVTSRRDWAWTEISEQKSGETAEKPENRDDAPPQKADSPLDEVGGDHGSLGNLLDNSLRTLSKGAMWLAGMIGGSLTQIAIALVLVFFLLKDAPRIGERLKIAAEKISGEKGLELLDLAGKTVKGVVNGVLGTALVQAIVAGIGFFIVGAPGAVLLGAMTFFFAIVPVGPPLIWGSVALWLFLKGEIGWGIFMLAYGAGGISLIDNVVRPILIGNENRMPFALILFGLIGGAMAFGFVGLFVGPTLLALAFRLTKGWTEGSRT